MRIKKIPIYVAICILFSLFFTASAYSKNDMRLKPGAKKNTCLKCHKTFKKKIRVKHLHTALKKGACTSCHTPHTSSHQGLLTEEPKAICLDCHKDIIPDTSKSLHGIVAEGKCNKCHDPHGSEIPFQLVKKGNSICYQCHQDANKETAGLKYKHPPLIGEKGCLNCHTPHASDIQRSLLKAKTPGLCIKCHDTQNSKFIASHKNYPVAKSECTSCHNPHGSNTKGMLFDNAHAPLVQKKCERCHTAETSAPLKIPQKGTGLCMNCHARTITEALGKNRLHWPLAGKDACRNCHTPHASKQKKLLNGPFETVCGKCHSDTVELQEWSKRNPKNKKLCEPVKSGNCVVCHSPHASNYPLLFEKPTSNENFCGRCHEWEKHSTHPIGDKIIDQRNKNLTLDCMSCHNACGTQNRPMMLHFQTTSELCIQCHTDRKR